MLGSQDVSRYTQRERVVKYKVATMRIESTPLPCHLAAVPRSSSSSLTLPLPTSDVIGPCRNAARALYDHGRLSSTSRPACGLHTCMPHLSVTAIIPFNHFEPSLGFEPRIEIFWQLFRISKCELRLRSSVPSSRDQWT